MKGYFGYDSVVYVYHYVLVYMVPVTPTLVKRQVERRAAEISYLLNTYPSHAGPQFRGNPIHESKLLMSICTFPYPRSTTLKPPSLSSSSSPMLLRPDPFLTETFPRRNLLYAVLLRDLSLLHLFLSTLEVMWPPLNSNPAHLHNISFPLWIFKVFALLHSNIKKTPIYTSLHKNWQTPHLL